MKKVCPLCKEEKELMSFEIYNIKIFSEESYRYGSFQVCYNCSDNKIGVYTKKDFIDVLREIIEIMKVE